MLAPSVVACSAAACGWPLGGPSGGNCPPGCPPGGPPGCLGSPWTPAGGWPPDSPCTCVGDVAQPLGTANQANATHLEVLRV